MTSMLGGECQANFGPAAALSRLKPAPFRQRLIASEETCTAAEISRIQSQNGKDSYGKFRGTARKAD
jgi:hypothetical protein